MRRSSTPPCYLAAYSVAPYLALALTSGAEVLEVRQYRVRATEPGRARQLLSEFAADYAVSALVVPPESWLFTASLEVGRSVVAMTQRAAKRALLRDSSRRTHPELFHHLIAKYPELRRLVTILPLTGRVAVSEPWRTVALLACALGLAAARLDNQRPSASLFTNELPVCLSSSRRTPVGA